MVASGRGYCSIGIRQVPATTMRNARLLTAFAFVQFILFPIPIITLFWKDQIGMSIADVMTLQAIFGLAVVVVEFPSGYFADRVGYRPSLLAGTALLTLGFLVYANATTFWTVAIAESILGSASAFMSGADRALLWVSLDTDGRRGEYTRWDGRMRAIGQTSEALSAGAGGWLYAQDPRWPFWCQVPAAAAAFTVAFTLRDAPRPRSSDTRSHARRMLHVLRFTLWRHRRLRAAMALSVALTLSTFVAVWLIQPSMQARGIPAAWFGPLWAISQLWMASSSLSSGRVARAFGPRACLITCCALVPIGYAGLSLTASAWGVAFYVCFMTVRGLQAPILSAVMQEDAPGEDRASVLSIAMLMFRLSFVLAGPPIGVLVDRAGLPVAFGVLAALLGVAALAAFSVFARAHEEAHAA